jgi:hypothetical protein
MLQAKLEHVTQQPRPAGVLAGAVSITAPCALVQSYGAALIGVGGGLVYTASSRLLVRWALLPHPHTRACRWPLAYPAGFLNPRLRAHSFFLSFLPEPAGSLCKCAALSVCAGEVEARACLPSSDRLCPVAAAAMHCCRLRVDDPADAAPVHFFCGAWGVLSVGFFALEASCAPPEPTGCKLAAA